MKKAAVAIEQWKQSIFETELKHDGFTYTTGPGLSPGTVLITVMTPSAEKLTPTLSRAMELARLNRLGMRH